MDLRHLDAMRIFSAEVTNSDKSILDYTEAELALLAKHSIDLIDIFNGIYKNYEKPPVVGGNSLKLID